MSQSIIFDTLQCSKRLQKAGFNQTQAEAQAAEMAKIINEQMVTKEDVSSLELRLIKWMLGIAVSQFIAFISFIKYIH